jgi:transcriptional regulator with XRE-family HTH domain
MKTAMAEPPKSRTVRPDGEKIKRLRQAKLWRVEDLARHAKCSVKTVENVEHGGNVYMFTLAKFATALGVENASLIAGGEVPAVPPKKERRIEVNLTISIPFDDFDQSDQLVSLIEKLTAVVKAQDHIELTGLMAGSTIITLEMSEPDVHLLIAAFMSGKLDEMQVQELNLRLTHEAPDFDDDVIDLTNVAPIGKIENVHFTSTLPDDVRIAGHPTTSEEATPSEGATAEKSATKSESKPLSGKPDVMRSDELSLKDARRAGFDDLTDEIRNLAIKLKQENVVRSIDEDLTQSENES